MVNYLNKNLYSRFGLELPVRNVQDGFKRYVKNSAFSNLGPIIYPDKYKNPKGLWDLQSEIHAQMCRQLFLDINDFEGEYISMMGNKSGVGQIIEDEICGDKPFNEFLFRLQVLLNILGIDNLKAEVANFIEDIRKYLIDFPLLGITIKIYKKKSPQIFPTTSKLFTKEIESSLDLIESKPEYKEILNHYESGLREFLSSKDQNQLKDAVEDMYTACDLTVASYFGDRKFGLRHFFQNNRANSTGMSAWEIKIFDMLRDWMDKIKHGAESAYTRENVEHIILLSSSFIRSLLNRKQ